LGSGWLGLARLVLSTTMGELPLLHKTPNVWVVCLCLSIVYIAICGLISFGSGPWPPLVSFALALGLGAGWYVVWERRCPNAVRLLPLGMVTVVLAACVGLRNHTLHYGAAQSARGGRTYRDVSPHAKAAAYLDAGVIHFAPDTVVDVSRSVGFKGYDYTYCAAPVFSRDRPLHPTDAEPNAQFWAVGLDCCAARGSFVCDGVGESQVLSAIVLHLPEGSARMSRDSESSMSDMGYVRAIHAACALHEIRSAEEPVLLRWTANPEGFLMHMRDLAVTVWLVSSAVFCALITPLWYAIHSLQAGQIRKAHLAAKASGQARGRKDHPVAVAKQDRLHSPANGFVAGDGAYHQETGRHIRDPFLVQHGPA